MQAPAFEPATRRPPAPARLVASPPRLAIPSGFRLALGLAIAAAAAQAQIAPPRETRLDLANEHLGAVWSATPTSLRFSAFHDKVNGVHLAPDMPAFAIDLGEGRILDAAGLRLLAPPRRSALPANPKATVLAERRPAQALEADFEVADLGLRLRWRAILRDGAPYARQELAIIPRRDGLIPRRIVLLDLALPGAAVRGCVRGSPIATETLYLAIEHPASVSEVKDGARAVASLPRTVPLPAGRPHVVSAVIGVAERGQLRRAFNRYLDAERAHPYRPFLHYNSWYDLNIDRSRNRMVEAEALASIRAIGTELTVKRGVPLASYVMDDGWDSHENVWAFHEGFPEGFTRVAAAAAGFGGAGIGLWMSPWGGYGGAKSARLASGGAAGCETNGNGFSMAGPRYGAHFRGTALGMIRDYRANFFKFDGMGGGNFADGGDSAYAADMDAILDVCRELRHAAPEVFISATVGTWPSPFWLRHADSIWRQGGDAGFSGVGNGRERWVTYRDATTYDRVVSRGPLFPIQSLMLHGVIVGERGDPARMDLDETSVGNEVRSFFGTGTCLQELYITPKLLTPAMWDAIAESAAWAQRRRDVLVDSHWVGGNPGKLEVYGFAAWRTGIGLLTLRNPSDKPQTFALDIGAAFELPTGERAAAYRFKSACADSAAPAFEASAGGIREIALQPFEVLVLEAEPRP